ncbi:MAG: inositol monophosphatase family protein [Thermostichales cyanobacterium SZTDM-1c_bins_54]
MIDPWSAPEKLLPWLHDLSQQVGSRLSQDFGQLQAQEKHDGTLVTAADHWADATLRQALVREFPDYGVLTEEDNHCFGGQEWCWVVDPLDGTTNFAHGIPIWGISLALLHQGSPVWGYVDFPLLGQTFYGWRTPAGEGVWLNGQPLLARPQEVTGNSLFSFCSRSISRLRPDGQFPAKIRMLGVATYNLLSVAAGWMVGGLEATPKVWDMAAVWLLVRLAGCCWSSPRQFFPLQPGQDYGRWSSPVLVTCHPRLDPLFLPYLEELSRQS